jgi:hypothetical protein
LAEDTIMACFFCLQRDELARFDYVEFLRYFALANDVLVLMNGNLLNEIFQTVLFLNLKLA